MAGRVLVTGGAGFVGANLVRWLLDSGWWVRVLDDLSVGRVEYLEGLDVELVKADVRDQPALLSALVGVDAVVHLAAAGSVVDSVADPSANFSANVVGTFTVLETMRRAGVGKLVFSSTGGALIGDAEPPVNESSLPRPISPYGASKLAGEAYLHAFAKAYGLRTVATRFANVYGRYSGHKRGVITRFFKAIHSGEPVTIFGDGRSSRDFMYVDDVCAGLERALITDVPGGSVFHLATGVETSVRQLADACCRAAGEQHHPIEFRPRRAGEVDRNVASYRLAQETLGFEPSVGLDEGLARTWDWYLRHEL